MADQGPASGNGELFLPAPGVVSGVFLEVHTQNGFQTPAATGVPGGVSGPASALNNLGPADFPYTPPTASGSVSSGAAVTPQTFQNYPVPSPNGGAGSLNLFRFKNPA